METVLYKLMLNLVILVSFTSSAAELRTKLAIVDTGIYLNDDIKPLICENGLLNYTNTDTIEDVQGHGTNLAYIAKQYLNPKKHCLVIVKVFNKKVEISIASYLRFLTIATEINVSYINLSFSGAGYIYVEERLLKRLVNAGITISTSAGNNASELTEKSCDVYPACYDVGKRFHVVGNGFNEHYRQRSSNHGTVVNYWEDGLQQCGGKRPGGTEICMTGTSQANVISISKTLVKEHP